VSEVAAALRAALGRDAVLAADDVPAPKRGD
jgi:hypothetical protein